jgi:predicted nucleic acid-binding protein
VAELRVALDTNVLIATVCPWHEHHPVTFRYLRGLHDGQATILIPGHCLLEAYSVLTRLPGSQRLTPQVAAEVLRASFSECRVVPMPNTGWREIGSFAASNTRGGRVYDAVIAEASFRAKAGVLLTWDSADFSGIAPPGLAIRTPG